MKGNNPMTTMTDNEWRSFVTAGTRLAHIALTRADGRPHVTPVCFILDGDELAFALSPVTGASQSASAMSGNPTAS
jgi:nitroimidazol reductase NimA-like FMN-containing flavoprotein (pyridoxamine 5'-phosphate oxidase superfamily)